jgi:hypothetical protein
LLPNDLAKLPTAAAGRTACAQPATSDAVPDAILLILRGFYKLLALDCHEC